MTVERDAAQPDPFGRANAWTGATPRMREVRHVHADHDPRAWHWFARGPLVAADGGERSNGPRGSSGRRSDGGEQSEEADEDTRTRERDVEDEQLRDVSHEPTHGEGANRVWDRGEDEDDAA